MFLKILIPYLLVMSVVAIAVCIYDKFAAKHATKHRTPEAVLLLLSALGGSVAMLLTMFIIRHKTKHAKFMVGIPAIIIVQAAIAVAVALLS